MSFQNRENAPEESAGESISDLPFGPAGNPWNQNVPMHLLSLEVPNPSWKVFHFQDSPKKCLIVSPPVEEFSQLSYPKVGQLEEKDFQLLPIGMGNEQRLKALNQLAHHLKSKQNNFLGYQLNQEPLMYEEAITPFLSLHANNLGDPFINSNNVLNTKVVERAVLDYYASLWHGVWPHNPKNGESYWGSVLSMGASEGNLYGLWTARDYLCSDSADFSSSLQQARRGPSVAGQLSQGKKAPVVFYSEDAHHSLIQAVDILGLKTFGQLGSLCYPHQNPLQPGQPWPREVPCHQGKKKGPGSIDINALAQLVEFFAHQGHPIIVCLTVGTGFKGGYDDVELAGQTLLPILAKYGLARLDVPTTVGQERRKGKEEAALDVSLPDKYWFHVDGALAATYLPFLEMAYYSGRFALRPPVFDFRLPFVSSITTSFHKWIGMPWPAGLFMTKTKFRRQDASGIPLGTIFSGSRNALTPVMLWDFFARNSFEVLIEKAISSQEVAEYAVEQLKRLEKELGQDLLIGRAELSLSIRFKQVNDNIAAKYSLSEEVFQFGEEGGQAEHYSVIFVMNHVSKQLIDQLIGDLRTQGAFKSSSEFTEVKSRVHGRGFR